MKKKLGYCSRGEKGRAQRASAPSAHPPAYSLPEAPEGGCPSATQCPRHCTLSHSKCKGTESPATQSILPLKPSPSATDANQPGSLQSSTQLATNPAQRGPTDVELTDSGRGTPSPGVPQVASVFCRGNAQGKRNCKPEKSGFKNCSPRRTCQAPPQRNR